MLPEKMRIENRLAACTTAAIAVMQISQKLPEGDRVDLATFAPELSVLRAFVVDVKTALTPDENYLSLEVIGPKLEAFRIALVHCGDLLRQPARSHMVNYFMEDLACLERFADLLEEYLTVPVVPLDDSAQGGD
jgi:hypothetical protein